MPRARFVAAEFGCSVSLGTKVYAVVGAEKADLRPDDLMFAANNDAMAFVSLYHLGLYHNSTFVWLPCHAIEKYLKCYLLASGGYGESDIRKVGHDVGRLWRLYRSAYRFPLCPSVEEYVAEVSAVPPAVRYGDMSVALNDNLLSGLILLAAHFNRYRRGSATYAQSYYGFWEEELQGCNALSKRYLVGVFQAYLHLVIEHQVTLSPTGVCHPHKYTEVGALAQRRVETDCPFCLNRARLDPSRPGLTTPAACQLVEEFIASRAYRG